MAEILRGFTRTKPIIGLLHLKGRGPEEVLQHAIHEFSIYEKEGVDGVLVENYYGNYYDMERVLEYLRREKPGAILGVNCLNHDAMGFDLAKRFHAQFLQLDSVVGHVKPRDEYTLEAFLEKSRRDYKGVVLGGVRFKYQPMLSERSEEEDLRIAMNRCDAIVVTQEATGQETSIEKIRRFRDVIGDFPLFIGAGITKENCEKQMKIGDGAIIGSYFKDSYKDTGDVCTAHVREMVQEFQRIRGERSD